MATATLAGNHEFNIGAITYASSTAIGRVANV
jgi:hypothetical protein